MTSKTGEDLLGGNIPLKAGTGSKPSTKRLNSVPIFGAVAVLGLASFVIVIALTNMGKREVLSTSEEDFEPLPTSSHVASFLSSREDGVIGGEREPETTTPTNLGVSSTIDPVDIIPLDATAQLAVPVAVVEDEEIVVDPLQAQIDELMRQQFIGALQSKHQRLVEATRSSSSVQFSKGENGNSMGVIRDVNNGVSRDDVQEQRDALSLRRDEIDRNQDQFGALMRMVEGRMVGALQGANSEGSPMALGESILEDPDTADDLAGGRALMPSGGALKSRGGLRVGRRVPRRQAVIQQEELDGELPRTLKNEFLLRQRKADSNYLDHSRLAPITKSELQAGTVIRANLISGINSDLPGDIIAQVSRNVFDSANGEHVLIPQGAKLLGQYDSNQSYGQSRVLISWNRLLFPDGSSLNLDKMLGYDVEGYSGFEDEVDNHWDKVFGGAIFTSVLASGVSAVTRNTERLTNDGALESSTALFQEELAKELAKVGTAIAERGLQVQPTIKIRPGYRFIVMVDKDVILPPYAPMHELYEKHFVGNKHYTHPRYRFTTDRSGNE